MKCIFPLLFFLQVYLGSAQISVISDFEDGSLQGWSNTDNTTVNLSIAPNDFGRLSLIKNSDGTDTSSGQLSLINNTTFTGDLFCELNGCWNYISFYIKNNNTFGLNLRVGITGVNGTKLLSEIIAMPTNFPLGTDWYVANVLFSPEEFSIYQGEGTFEETLSDVAEIRIIQNEAYSFDGVAAVGNFELDSILLETFTLSVKDFSLNNLKVFPNPARDELNLKAEIQLETYVIYTLLGTKVAQGTVSNTEKTIDVSSLTTGAYIIEVTAEGQSTSQKFIKQ